VSDDIVERTDEHGGVWRSRDGGETFWLTLRARQVILPPGSVVLSRAEAERIREMLAQADRSLEDEVKATELLDLLDERLRKSRSKP
jgi:hypothetical protein